MLRLRIDIKTFNVRTQQLNLMNQAEVQYFLIIGINGVAEDQMAFMHILISYKQHSVSP